MMQRVQRGIGRGGQGGAEPFGTAGDTLKIAHRAHAGHKGQPQLAAGGRGGQNLDRPNLPRCSRMRTAAGDHLVIAHGHHAHMLGNGGALAQGQSRQLVGRREPAEDGIILLYAGVDHGFQRIDLLRRQARAPAGQIHIDGGFRLPQVQADRHCAVQLPRRPGDHMIARVLLHMIQPTRPIDAAMHRRVQRRQRVQPVPYHAVLHLHVGYMGGYIVPLQRTRIVGLPARGGIKRRAIQRRPAVRADGGHPRVKRGQISVVIVKSIGRLHKMTSWKCN